nr:MAG TPA: hypothetical protein [Caudoviricetes sp.]
MEFKIHSNQKLLKEKLKRLVWKNTGMSIRCSLLK